MNSKSLGQAGRPSGFIGRLFGKIMVRHNALDNEWTIDRLNVRGNERILEVGFGPGAAVESLVKRYPAVRVDGIDHSEVMLQTASARNYAAIAAGRVALHLGTVADLPFSDSTFEKAFAVNCIYFWESPLQGLAELYRVIKPGGRAGITVRDKHRDAYLAFRPERLREMFCKTGFSEIEIHTNGVASHPLFCAVGTR